MDAYGYIFLSLAFVIIAVALLIRRRDLWRPALGLALLGGAASAPAEFFYTRDYWRPVHVLGGDIFSLEAVLFGSAILIVGAFAYPVVCKQNFTEQIYPQRLLVYLVFFMAGAAALIVATFGLKIGSVYSSSLIFLLSAMGMVSVRRDLWRPVLTATVLASVLSIIVYLIVFGLLSPGFWDQYWLLAGTAVDVRLFGLMPLTELLWYLAWIPLAAVGYPFITGRGFRPKVKNTKESQAQEVG